MDISRDYEDLFKTLNRFKIKYLVVGAYAVAYYAEPRFTKDIDIWIIPDMNDPTRVMAALKAFGAPLTNVRAEDFASKEMIYQIGVAPVRIDILTDLVDVDKLKAAASKHRRA